MARRNWLRATTLLSLGVLGACGEVREQPIIIDDSLGGASNAEAGAHENPSAAGHADLGDGGRATEGDATVGGDGGTNDGGTSHGGEGTVGSDDHDAPSIIEVSPKDGATDAEPMSPIALRFTEPMADASINADSFQLWQGDEPIAGKQWPGGEMATFNATSPLRILTKYTIKASQGMTDLAENALDEPFLSRFTTRDGRWLPETPVHAATDARIGIDAAGNTLVGSIVDGAPTALWLDATGKELSLQDVDTTTSAASNLAVAVDPNGDAVIVYRKSDKGELWARRYTDGAWEPEAVRIESAVTAKTVPYAGPLVTYRGGQIVVAWISVYALGDPKLQTMNTRHSTAKATSAWSESSGKSWSKLEADALSPHLSLAGNARGDAMVLYAATTTGTSYGPVYETFDAASGTWTEGPAMYGKNPYDVGVTEAGCGPVVALADDGSAVAAWCTSAADSNLVGTHFVSGGGWSQPQTLETATGSSRLSDQAVALHGGRFTVTFKQEVATNQFNVYRADFPTVGTDFNPTELLSAEGATAYLGEPRVAGDTRGNALAIWASGGDDKTTAPKLLYSRYIQGGSWSAPEEVSGAWTPASGYVPTKLCVGPSGTAGAISKQYSWASGSGAPLYHAFR